MTNITHKKSEEVDLSERPGQGGVITPLDYCAEDFMRVVGLDRQQAYAAALHANVLMRSRMTSLRSADVGGRLEPSCLLLPVDCLAPTLAGGGQPS